MIYRNNANNSIFGKDILVKLHKNYNGCVILKTCCRSHGYIRSFYMDAEKLYHWMRSADGESFYDSDGGDFVRIDYNPSRERYDFVVVLIKSCYDGDVVGVMQRFSVPEEIMRKIKEPDDEFTYLANTAEDPRPRIEFTERAQALIKKYAYSKTMRNALVKAMRDNFRWPNEKWVRIYVDFNEFGFCDSNGMRGGLIASTFTIRGKDGKKYPKTTFNVHT